MAAPIIIIMGPPGAGKGTQSALLAKRLGGIHLSSGQLLREARDPKLLATMAAGDLVVSVEVERIIATALKRVAPEQSIVLDGFTRMISEAKWLEDQAAKLDRPIAAVIYLKVDQPESVTRNRQRGRLDDSLSAQAERWRLYQTETEPVLDFYHAKGLVHEVDGVGSIEAVADRIGKVIT